MGVPEIEKFISRAPHQLLSREIPLVMIPSFLPKFEGRGDSRGESQNLLCIQSRSLRQSIVTCVTGALLTRPHESQEHKTHYLKSTHFLVSHTYSTTIQ